MYKTERYIIYGESMKTGVTTLDLTLPHLTVTKSPS